MAAERSGLAVAQVGPWRNKSRKIRHMGTNGNGLGRFIPQLREITLTFCRKGGSSQGVRCAALGGCRSRRFHCG